jgi:hypothetical protein
MDNTKLYIKYVRIIEMKYNYEVIRWINYRDLWNKKTNCFHIFHWGNIVKNIFLK